LLGAVLFVISVAFLFVAAGPEQVFKVTQDSPREFKRNLLPGVNIPFYARQLPKRLSNNTSRKACF